MDFDKLFAAYRHNQSGNLVTFITADGGHYSEPAGAIVPDVAAVVRPHDNMDRAEFEKFVRWQVRAGEAGYAGDTSLAFFRG